MNRNGLTEKPPVVLFSLFTLKEGEKWWAFRQMGLAQKHLKGQKDLKFGALMGTGQGRGFSIRPNFERYALFTSWKEEEAAEDFMKESPLFNSFCQRSREVFTSRLLPFLVKGKWKGSNPLVPLAPLPEEYQGPVVALTRANIRLQRLLEFWNKVPGVSNETKQAKGLLAQTGMGEWPIIEQATFSIWENQQCLQEFAYRMRQHQEVIRKTRSRQWYSEELFARFIPAQAEGCWDGVNPLGGYSLPTITAL